MDSPRKGHGSDRRGGVCGNVINVLAGRPLLSVGLGVLLGVVVVAPLVPHGSRAGGAAVNTLLRAAGGDPASKAAADRAEALAMWSKMFGRELRDGEGPQCSADAYIARTSNHALINMGSRSEMGSYLQQLGIDGVGVELGVQRGEFSHETLTQWTNCSKYILVDPWAHQKDYVDAANVQQEDQEVIFAQAKELLEPFKAKTEFRRMYSTEAVKDFPDCGASYVYVDAVHDFWGALADMIDWWPKIKPGGILAGHDYLDAIIPGDTIFGVRSAANRFAMAVNRPLHFTTNDGDYPTFWIIKSPEP